MMKFLITKRTMTLACVLMGAAAAEAGSTISPDGLAAAESEVTVNSIVADRPGYIVVHTTDFTGTIPGAVVGHAPIKAGENTNVSVPLDKKLKSGTLLIVMLHEEANNDSDFDSRDKPAKSALGPVQQIVTVR